jgi:HEAT repeat protein
MNLRSLSVRLAALALVAASLTPARAADGDDVTGKDLDELVSRLRNPFFAKQAERDLQIIQLLLRQKTAKADGCLRELLADTGAHPTVVEQIAVATLIDAEHRLLPEVVDRLRRESGSALDRSLDLSFVTYSDATVVARLAEFARDASRPMPFRVASVDTLGRTGNPEALDPLLDLWGGPVKELRDPAARAFERIFPVGAPTREEAAAAREEIRNVPFVEAMRRLLRRNAADAKRGAKKTDVGGRMEQEYVRLAAQALPRATLAELIESYLGSSVAAVRAMGARRLVDFTYDGGDARVRAARECLVALRREDAEAVELELLAALAVLAPELRGAVGEADLASLTERVKLTGRTSNAVRLASVRLVGELRDARAVAVMQETFTSLGDGDVELRLALLDALQQSPGDLTAWLISRLPVETHSRVVRKLVVLLNRAADPAAIDAFRRLLATHPDQQVRWDVAKALGTLWAGRQLVAARDALMENGLSDSDATVRRTSAAALGSAGPGRDAIVARLVTTLVDDGDAKVREAAAKSVIDLDEASAANNLLPFVADDADIWRLFRDRLVDDVRRRDKTPDRVLAAADELSGNGLSRLAVDLLTQVSAEHDGLWEGDGGRVAVLERLASLLIEQGDPDAAATVAKELVDGLARDAGAPRARADLLLATAHSRSGRRDELIAARRRLEVLRSDASLPADRRDFAEVELGDCLLRLGEPLAAQATLAPVCAKTDLPAALAKKAALLLEDATKRSSEERKQIVSWIDALDSDEAKSGLSAFGVRAAPYVLATIEEAKDRAGARRAIRAASVVVGKTLDVPAENAPAGDFAKAIEEARAELRGLIERSANSGEGAR